MSTKLKTGFKIEVIEDGIAIVSGQSATGKSTYGSAFAQGLGLPTTTCVSGSTPAGVRQFLETNQPHTMFLDDLPKRYLKVLLPIFREYTLTGWHFVVAIDPSIIQR